MRRVFTTIILVAVIAPGIPAAAHHSNPFYFDMSKSITLEGEVLRVEWINPHILVYLQSKNDKGELETWVLQGASLNSPSARTAQRAAELGTLKDRLKPGISITVRVWPSRNPLYVNDAQTVQPTHPDDARRSARIVGAGEARFSDGDVVWLGGGPKF